MSKLHNEIESTLDHLISNAHVLKRIAFDEKFGDETSALQKTQESLLSHLIELEAQREELGLEKKEVGLIEAKLKYFAQLNHELVNQAYKNYST